MLEIKDNQIYTREEAEKLLQISQSTMRRLIKSGVIRAAKIGGQYRILGAELLRQFLPPTGYETVREVYRQSRKKVHHMESELKKEQHELKNNKNVK
ncbi:MAG: helix-turn-helix domain-containing protein [Oligoflexia bacterium]|nr:helix-turn-helix domain-containing protein [Oligoflexia bacterium]